MPEYDFAATMREEVEQLRRELVSPDVRPAVAELARRFGTSDDEALAALWRASKRHGETLAVFASELRGQLERESAATASGGTDVAPEGAPAGGAAAPGGSGPAGATGA